MEESPVCELHKVGRAIVVYVEGFDPASYESKSYDWDLAELGFQFERWGLPTEGPGYEKLHRQLQGVWGAPEEVETKSGRRREKTNQLAIETPPDQGPDPPEVDAWLRSPSLLGYLEDAISARGSDDPLLGEEDTAIQALLTLLAKRSLEVRGQSGAGKNDVVEHVLSIFPRKWWEKVGGLTDKSLRYLPGDLKILYITERRGMETGRQGEESTAEYDVKLGISEGEITVFVTETNEETKRMETHLRKVMIESFIFTTTEVSAPPELENRLTVLNVKDDAPQNELVRNDQLMAAKCFPWEKSDPEPARAIARRVLERVWKEGPTAAIVPFADALKPILSIESASVRRNTPKVLDLVRASAKLHYLQRERTSNGRGVIAQTEDLALALYTGQRSLGAMLSAIPPKAALVWKIAKILDQSMIPITTGAVMVNAGENRAELGSKRTIRAAVDELVERGILAELDERQGKFKVYSLQSWDVPLVIKVDELLQDAERQYQTWAGTPSRLPSAMNQSGQEVTAIDAPAMIMTATPSNAANPNSDGITADGSRREVPIQEAEEGSP